MDLNQKVVFFTPRGRALHDAPPAGDGWTEEAPAWEALDSG